MKIFIEIAEAAERLEELIEFAARGDEIIISRDERRVATYIAKKAGTMEEFLAAEDRASVPNGITSAHDDLYDERGLPK
ncbi:antitoxin (DNA-binding transcriptional repressor) of toxin-antitoxin stability system [Rhizobium sp. BK650]|uniref:prevent-host-death family protein n=1 Tax=Rhizobium sp. BK650 TaxID=2586990 RepID=UPI00160782C0|nr:prevent-host-death family protein [Rhizobium sp. BK650]MBB3660014.1 antitoxin (DNA-binding transcriptional repressor) of toxin-antitoxin stability system [Rhizobium sp. BK650]